MNASIQRPRFVVPRTVELDAEKETARVLRNDIIRLPLFLVDAVESYEVGRAVRDFLQRYVNRRTDRGDTEIEALQSIFDALSGDAK